MTWAAAILIAIGFLALARLLRVTTRAAALIDTSRAALSTLRNQQLAEAAKEQALRRHTLELLAGLGAVLPLTLAALMFPIGLVWVLDLCGAVRLSEVLELTVTWEFLVVATIVAIAYALFLRRLARRREA